MIWKMASVLWTCINIKIINKYKIEKVGRTVPRITGISLSECSLNYPPLAWGIMSGSFSKLSMLSELRGKVDDLSRGEELPVPDAARFAMPPSSWESLSSWDLGRYRNLTARTITKITSRRPAVAPTTAPSSGPDSDSITGVKAGNRDKYREPFPSLPFVDQTVSFVRGNQGIISRDTRERLLSQPWEKRNSFF